ncbi:MAG: glycosyltransferase family 2 protein [Alphaproteobacteria bacterium]|nr:glycosyltransferase family 2 protein [Alphaproteobacteria bacterium]
MSDSTVENALGHRQLGSTAARLALPAISVVLCTRNRADSLARCLTSWEKVQTTEAWELVVINNGSVDHTSALLQDLVARAKLPLIIGSEIRPGLSQARNAGLRYARGSIVCFTDDDCYPDVALIDAWLQVFRDPNIDYAGGRIELFDLSDAEVTIKTDPESRIIPPRSFVKPGFLHGASLAFRRKVIEQVGQFNPLLGAGARFKSGEDCDYVQRASELGFVGLYTPRPVVWHHHGRKINDVPLLMRGYDVGRGAFYAGILSRRPGILKQVIVADFKQSASLFRYLRSLVRRGRDRFPLRWWDMARGAFQFATLSAFRAVRR